jgi:hypothetical protein
VLLVALLAALCRVAVGDVFVLTGGGRVVGELLNPDETPRESYRVKTASGAQIVLSRSQVEEWLRPRPAEIEYQKIRPRYPDTVEGQWALAEWCRERSLRSERDVHLERILELEPDHEDARRALGYFKRDGEWVTEKEFRKSRGFVRHGGRWLLPQEVDIIEEREAAEAAVGEWKKKLHRWQDWIGGERTLLAYQNIQRIDDPAAVPAVAAALRTEPDDQARLLFIEALARIGTPLAKEALAMTAMADPVPEVRLTCLDHLKTDESPRIVEFFIGGLRSKDNVEVNLAAVALGELGNPTAVPPLIEALVTVHKFTVPSGNPGQVSTTFGNGGGGSPGGLSVGGSPKIVPVPFKNQAVHDALVSLTGVDYGFDVGRWKAWHAARQRSLSIDARRD